MNKDKVMKWALVAGAIFNFFAVAVIQALEDCLAEVFGKFKEQLKSLLTLNFQTFQNITL